MVKPKIVSKKFIGQNNPKNRKIKVKLSNGVTITIKPLYESWQQWGGNKEELYITMPIAQKYNRWLHGGTKSR